MACSRCCYTAEDCPDCGQCLCDCSCDADTCTFCGDPDCDGSGYNCPDNHYQEYNLRGWETAGKEERS